MRLSTRSSIAIRSARRASRVSGLSEISVSLSQDYFYVPIMIGP